MPDNSDVSAENIEDVQTLREVTVTESDGKNTLTIGKESRISRDIKLQKIVYNLTRWKSD